ncbi:MAG TPA: ABC transporter ATP-binding protein [Candidatus Paceibacterota bacterium]|nr:ABC transporter ATP-binding protein [Candidatus Paceibacterota bacterium]HOK97225.1 ABC transporter ATP-binding protein [Candidatus Paceibacterota bacterium]HPP64584.1 ABC transporter ATP-binding protein [Candidatus Paceibacterota bacterium]
MLETKNITKIYKTGEIETRALDGVSLRVNDGEFVAIMGPSGSGKSTLMHILGCLDTPTSGKYILDGEDVSNLSDDELAKIRNKKIGFVFQSFNLLPRVTIFKNVMLPLLYSNQPLSKREQLAKEALEAVSFAEKFWFYYPNQISGGMAQRVAIARALVNDPSIILADEPTGNLDSKSSEAIMETLCFLHQKQKRTIVMITHEPDIAQYAQRIIYLKDGKIVSDEENKNKIFFNFN